MQQRVKRPPNRRYLTPSGKTLERITKIHSRLYRLTGGVLGHHLLQVAEKGSRFPLRVMRVLLLTTTGRKSGLARTVPLPYFEYEGRRLLVGSFSGGPRHPAWYHNVRANPKVEIQIGPKHYSTHVVILEGAERDRLWEILAGDWPRYQLYQDRTSRRIPLVEIPPDSPR